MSRRTHKLLEANTRYLLRARLSEQLLLKLLETHTMRTKPTLELINDIEKHLKSPWL